MSVKASLKIILMANDVEIAESEDKILWQNVFSAINQGTDQIAAEQAIAAAPAPITTVAPSNGAHPSVAPAGTGAMAQLAAELGISTDEVEGALAPSTEAPFIHLDPHCWEALKKNTPNRGGQAIAPIALVGTLLALWFRHGGIEGSPTTKQCQAVLKTIHLSDKNAGRSLKNAEWLQVRNSGIVINPAKRSRAVAVAKAYCSQSPIANS